VRLSHVGFYEGESRRFFKGGSRCYYEDGSMNIARVVIPPCEDGSRGSMRMGQRGSMRVGQGVL
jgi:hypothetical protein